MARIMLGADRSGTDASVAEYRRLETGDILCLRSSTVRHTTASSFGSSTPWGEVKYQQRRCGAIIRPDPLHKPNLIRKAEDYSLHFDLPIISRRQEFASRVDEAA